MKMVRKKNKTFRIPKKISVLGRVFSIREVSGLTVNGKEAAGSCCVENLLIEIDKDLDISQKIGILAHEIGHAGMVIFGLDQRITAKENEIFCQLIKALIEDYISAFKK